jgi:hypothetical protein
VPENDGRLRREYSIERSGQTIKFALSDAFRRHTDGNSPSRSAVEFTLGQFPKSLTDLFER